MKKLVSPTFTQTPLFPTESSWKLPRDLPNLSAAKEIGLDTETRDPQLIEKGPGVRRDGYIVGISVAVSEGQSWYLPFGHSEGEQFEKEKVMLWAKDNLCRPKQPKIGANIIYDLDYLYHNGVKVSGPFYDIQVAEPLINENAQSYSLDTLAKKYLGEAKREDLLARACSDHDLKGAPQKHIWCLDPKYIGLYAEGDAEQALLIFKKQKEILKKENLEKVFDIETRLIPMLLHMRQLGVPINMDRLLKLHDKMTEELIGHKQKLDSVAGEHVDFWAAESIARVFDKKGLPYPLTPKTKKPSFVKGWLENQTDNISKLIMKCREIDKFKGTFLEGSLLEMIVGGRIHCQFNQLRSDDFGTVTGRFSSSNPNLQFIPTRTELGKLCRKVFIPDEEYGWCKADYSQIELRILVHYARGAGADLVVEAFKNDPTLDYHQLCADMANVSRTFAKKVNFGLIYGMGVYKLAQELGISIEEAKRFKNKYFNVLPFLKTTVDAATDAAMTKGYVRTILGRRRRFELWEPKDRDLAKIINAHPDKNKVQKEINNLKNLGGKRHHQGIQRAGCYKAFNAADQGSAADIMKMALVDVWESGVCSVIKPYITVHDELDFGYPLNSEGEEAILEVKHIMENTYELKIPAIVDVETGPNWGNVKEFKNG